MTAVRSSSLEEESWKVVGSSIVLVVKLNDSSQLRVTTHLRAVEFVGGDLEGMGRVRQLHAYGVELVRELRELESMGVIR